MNEVLYNIYLMIGPAGMILSAVYLMYLIRLFTRP
jgi:hypothetical protein